VPKKSIVQLAPFYFPHLGGVEKHLLKVNRELQQRGYDIAVITQQHLPDLPLKEKVEGSVVIRLKTSGGSHGSWIRKTKYKLSIWQGVFNHLPLLRKAEIIQIHDVFFWLLPFLVFLPRKKLFMTFHGYEGGEKIGSRQRFWHQLASKLTQNNLCIGAFHQRWYGVQPGQISYGAVATRPTPPKKQPRRRLVFIGRLHPDTGIMAHLEALKILQNKNPKYRLDVYGDGPQMPVAAAYTKKHRLNAVFHGFSHKTEELVGKYQVAFVSGYLSILEALAAKTLPICFYDNNLRKEYLESTPFSQWLIKASNPRQIAQAVLNDEQLHQKAVSWAKKQSWTKLTNNYQQLWYQTKSSSSN